MSDGTTAAAGVRTARELVGRSQDPVLNPAACMPSVERVAAVHRLRRMYA